VFIPEGEFRPLSVEELEEWLVKKIEFKTKTKAAKVI
jgi:hypothetical protein